MMLTPRLVDYSLVSVMFAFMVIEVFLFAALCRAETRDTVGSTRLRAYAYFTTYQWALVAFIAILWFETKRPWSALLLGSPNGWVFAISLALAAGYLTLTTMQRREIAKRPKSLERLAGQMADIKALVPHTLQERRIWTFAAVTAGTCEEVLFRGYLLTFVESLAGIIAAVLVSSLLFGLYHAYFGPSGILKTGALGLFFALVALWSGSLIPVIIIHATIDLTSGDVGYRILTRRQASLTA